MIGPAIALHTDGEDDGANAAWRESVGAPASSAGRESGTMDGATLAVLSWNVWIGRGRLAPLVTRIRDGGYAAQGIPAGAPLVVLVQEAYRESASVPDRVRPRTTPRTVLGGREEDITDAADALGLALAYAPSMRNGRHRSDRGNAILATVPLHEPEAVELPFAYQRRVAVCAGIVLERPGGARTRLRLCSAHLDPRGARALDVIGVAGRARQTEGLVRHLDRLAREPQVLGADLNLARGAAEPAFRRLRTAGFEPGLPPAWPAWSHTYHRWPRLLLDWVLARDPNGALAGVAVMRLDEQPDDRGHLVFGSDHHPLLARLDLAPA